MNQYELEQEMQEMGVNRYNKVVAQAVEQQNESVTPYGVTFIQSVANRLVDRLTDLKKDYNRGVPLGYPSQAVILLDLIPIETAAFLAIKTAVNYMSSNPKVQKIAMLIATAIEDEYRFRNFKSLNKALYEVLLRDLKKRKCSYRMTKTILIRTANRAGIPLERVPVAAKFRFGAMLVDVLCHETGLFECRKYSFGPKMTPYLFVATKKCKQWVTRKNSIMELMSPVRLPMVEPPVPWTGVMGGGYKQTDTKLIKTWDKGYLKELSDSISNGECTAALAAVNTIMETPWKINGKILDVMEKLTSLEGEFPCLPNRSEIPITDYPKKGSPKDVIIDWKRRASQIHAENLRRKSRRLQHTQLLWAARKFRESPELYFPHTLDFRGRLYAMSSFLNPQADDRSRGLLCFAEGKPLGPSGEGWLAVHGANCWGYDKASLEDRVEWTLDNEESLIFPAALDPIGFEGWQTADKPWQFLAFCLEWYHHRKVDPDAPSHLPVAIDGSCNGLQHFSAMLRDREGGASVNLTPSTTGVPSDIYQIVADRVEATLPSDSPWKGRVDRKLVKRPVMTTPYGAKLYGMRSQIREEVISRMDQGDTFPFDEGDLWEPVGALAEATWNAIGDTVKSARRAMTWLQAVSRMLAKAGIHEITWVVPTGLPIKQAYLKPIRKKLRTVMNDRHAFLFVKFRDGETDPVKMANGISPNFIHSMDSAHLMLTVLEAREQLGIKSFHVVHDSFGVHAADVEPFSEIIRRVFVDIYSRPVLEEFRDGIIKMMKQREVTITKEMKKLLYDKFPKKGSLDINSVLDADFFFS